MSVYNRDRVDARIQLFSANFVGLVLAGTNIGGE